MSLTNRVNEEGQTFSVLSDTNANYVTCDKESYIDLKSFVDV